MQRRLEVGDDVRTSGQWGFGTRLAFRFAFCYFTLYALCSGIYTVWETIPWAGSYIENWLAWPFLQAAQWLGLHALHLHGIGTTLGDSDSGDTVLNWIAVGVILAVAVVATLLWTALDRRRKAYLTLLAWFRFTLRLTLASQCWPMVWTRCSSTRWLRHRSRS